jgi:eukaryotic-like serine/threonine-protein kinase
LYLRAEAYRQQGAWAEAASEYERLIQHRGTDPYAPMVPLAWLGLGRVRAETGNLTVSRTSYEMALSMWRAADSDFPPRLAAQAEYDRLTSGSGLATESASTTTSPRAR